MSIHFSITVSIQINYSPLCVNQREQPSKRGLCFSPKGFESAIYCSVHEWKKWLPYARIAITPLQGPDYLSKHSSSHQNFHKYWVFFPSVFCLLPRQSIKHYPSQLIVIHDIPVKKKIRQNEFRCSQVLRLVGFCLGTWSWDVVRYRDSGEAALRPSPRVLHSRCFLLPVSKRVGVFRMNPWLPFLGYQWEENLLQWLGHSFCSRLGMGASSDTHLLYDLSHCQSLTLTFFTYTMHAWLAMETTLGKISEGDADTGYKSISSLSHRNRADVIPHPKPENMFVFI